MWARIQGYIIDHLFFQQYYLSIFRWIDKYYKILSLPTADQLRTVPNARAPMLAAKAEKYCTHLEPWNWGKSSSPSHSLKRKLARRDLCTRMEDAIVDESPGWFPSSLLVGLSNNGDLLAVSIMTSVLLYVCKLSLETQKCLIFTQTHLSQYTKVKKRPYKIVILKSTWGSRVFLRFVSCSKRHVNQNLQKEINLKTRFVILYSANTTISLYSV